MSRLAEIEALAGGEALRATSPCKTSKTPPDGPESRLSGDFIPATLTGAELASLLGLSTRHLQNLAANGVIQPDGRNRYSARAAISSYCAYIHARRASDALSEEKLRLASAQAEKVELSNARERGEMLDAQEVKREWLGLIADLRAALLAVPARVAAAAGLDRPTATRLDEEIRLALASIAESDHE